MTQAQVVTARFSEEIFFSPVPVAAAAATAAIHPSFHPSHKSASSSPGGIHLWTGATDTVSPLTVAAQLPVDGARADACACGSQSACQSMRGERKRLTRLPGCDGGVAGIRNATVVGAGNHIPMQQHDICQWALSPLLLELPTGEVERHPEQLQPTTPFKTEERAAQINHAAAHDSLAIVPHLREAPAMMMPPPSLRRSMTSDLVRPQLQAATQAAMQTSMQAGAMSSASMVPCHPCPQQLLLPTVASQQSTVHEDSLSLTQRHRPILGSGAQPLPPDWQDALTWWAGRSKDGGQGTAEHPTGQCGQSQRPSSRALLQDLQELQGQQRQQESPTVSTVKGTANVLPIREEQHVFLGGMQSQPVPCHSSPSPPAFPMLRASPVSSEGGANLQAASTGSTRSSTLLSTAFSVADRSRSLDFLEWMMQAQLLSHGATDEALVHCKAQMRSGELLSVSSFLGEQVTSRYDRSLYKSWQQYSGSQSGSASGSGRGSGGGSSAAFAAAATDCSTSQPQFSVQLEGQGHSPLSLGRMPAAVPPWQQDGRLHSILGSRAVGQGNARRGISKANSSLARYMLDGATTTAARTTSHVSWSLMGGGMKGGEGSAGADLKDLKRRISLPLPLPGNAGSLPDAAADMPVSSFLTARGQVVNGEGGADGSSTVLLGASASAGTPDAGLSTVAPSQDRKRVRLMVDGQGCAKRLLRVFSQGNQPLCSPLATSVATSAGALSAMGQEGNNSGNDGQVLEAGLLLDEPAAGPQRCAAPASSPPPAKKQHCKSGLLYSSGFGGSQLHPVHLSSLLEQQHTWQNKADIVHGLADDCSPAVKSEKMSKSGVLPHRACTETLPTGILLCMPKQQVSQENEYVHLMEELKDPFTEAMDTTLADDFQAFCAFVDEVCSS